MRSSSACGGWKRVLEELDDRDESGGAPVVKLARERGESTGGTGRQGEGARQAKLPTYYCLGRYAGR